MSIPNRNINISGRIDELNDSGIIRISEGLTHFKESVVYLPYHFENYLSRQFIETVNNTDNSFVQEYVPGII